MSIIAGIKTQFDNIHCSQAWISLDFVEVADNTADFHLFVYCYCYNIYRPTWIGKF